MRGPTVALALGRARRVRPVDAGAAAGAAIYTVLLARTLAVPSFALYPLLAAPWLAFGLLAVTRRPLPTSVRLAVGWCVLACVSVGLARLVVLVPVLAVALPALLIAFAVARRRPAGMMIGAFVLTGTYGTLTAYGNLPSGPAVDLLLGATWLAALSVWLLHGPGNPVWLWPGAIFAAIFIGAGVFYVIDAETLNIGVKWFRASLWYFAATLLVAYGPWPAGSRTRIARAVLVIAIVVGAYATLRWVTGPSGRERVLAQQFANNFLNGELRPIGSFTSPKEMSAWCAIVLPFCFVGAMAFRDRWRVVAIGACGLLTTAMFAADVRAAPVAAGAGALAVILLLVGAQAFSGGHKTGVVTLAIVALAVGGTAAYAVTLGGKEDSAQRFSNILAPGRDPSVVARKFKWRNAIADIQQAPLGHGAGTAGRDARLVRFASIGNWDIDNSYLKIAFEQGFAMMALFIVAALLLLGGLVRRSVLTADPQRAALAIGAAGTLVSMLVLFFTADYVEGLPALAGWMIVGLGMAQFASGSRAEA
jgi:hypothetical protein